MTLSTTIVKHFQKLAITYLEREYKRAACVVLADLTKDLFAVNLVRAFAHDKQLDRDGRRAVNKRLGRGLERQQSRPQDCGAGRKEDDCTEYDSKKISRSTMHIFMQKEVHALPLAPQRTFLASFVRQCKWDTFIRLLGIAENHGYPRDEASAPTVWCAQDLYLSGNGSAYQIHIHVFWLISVTHARSTSCLFLQLAASERLATAVIVQRVVKTCSSVPSRVAKSASCREKVLSFEAMQDDQQTLILDEREYTFKGVELRGTDIAE